MKPKRPQTTLRKRGRVRIDVRGATPHYINQIQIYENDSTPLLAFAGACLSGERCAGVWAIAGPKPAIRQIENALVGTPNMQNSFPPILTYTSSNAPGPTRRRISPSTSSIHQRAVFAAVALRDVGMIQGGQHLGFALESNQLATWPARVYSSSDVIPTCPQNCRDR